MSDLGKNLDEQSYHARADRRFTQGLVLAVDALHHTCTLDVGAYDVTGTPVHLEEVPYQPQTPPSIGDKVGLVYANASPHSVAVAGGALSGQNVQGSLQVVGAVTSLAAAGGGAPLQGPVLIAGAGTVSVSESGHTLTLTGSGLSGVKAEVGGSTEVGPESVLNFIAGTGIASITVADNPPDIDITINVSAGAGGVTSFNGATGAVTGVASLNSLTGALTLAAGTNISLGVSGSTITINSSSGGSSAPTWPVTVIASGTTAYTALSTDTVLFCFTETTAQTITLPNAATFPGKIYVIFNVYQGASQGLAVAATGPSTIVGISNLNGLPTRKSVWYISDGTNWHSFDNSSGN